ncbi:Vi polysaccharide biosynthesis UDP-N-acetylglucosamine C-6 dehydrogenase TviB [Marinobacterium arenosum]|uniref:Vi polysaccharide biosynthesis UDP-N-acetylglucosamine C-6 dehydrogenase TviB n=1 Tax=Marinobacterium arenosum TaxID=2862496 RepID=UPI001C985939|nr:Vi polysaccharide biosynthesis UDP-N-acetylglucosamine C-6 dehydrogenase TviB [Marinobacterium arenosum]MBY4675990.1 Vi polysaccharide biosynthesis UDP-N-acetylglucosamine C-6 dehydrogenase TviB [Marinobacterium arenosum]
MLTLEGKKICVLGLGYVGLPLAVEFGKRLPTVGFDINQARVAELKAGRDSTLEVEPELLAEAHQLSFTAQLSEVADCNIYIVTVPTPIDEYKQPDLSPLRASSAAIGEVLAKGDVVIYESTVYPGATEEVCVPELERVSGLRFNEDFFVGYSPERINPGDKNHRLPTIVKVTSGSTPEVAELVDQLYRSIITAGTHKASSIKVAEASKVIENTQRDLNIALINELSIIFEKVGIDTLEVLEAAGTKWNFLPFRPGLVGGHCIGVDPYYLTHKAQSLGYFPDVILAGRRINDGMGQHVASRVIKLMVQKGITVPGSRLLILGLSFKENCPDIRNTRVLDLLDEFADYQIEVDIHDPWVDPQDARHEYGIELVERPQPGDYDAVVLAVNHVEFQQLGADAIHAFGKAAHVLFDVKSALPADQSDGRL